MDKCLSLVTLDGDDPIAVIVKNLGKAHAAIPKVSPQQTQVLSVSTPPTVSTMTKAQVLTARECWKLTLEIAGW
jgi:hypothetical protein